MNTTVTLLATLLLVPLTGLAATQNSKPNIVLILADDLGYGDVSCYGATKIQTPNIDRLSREGMKFTDAHTAASVCSPSRYGLMTGRYRDDSVQITVPEGMRGALPDRVNIVFGKQSATKSSYGARRLVPMGQLPHCAPMTEHDRKQAS